MERTLGRTDGPLLRVTELANERAGLEPRHSDPIRVRAVSNTPRCPGTHPNRKAPSQRSRRITIRSSQPIATFYPSPVLGCQSSQGTTAHILVTGPRTPSGWPSILWLTPCGPCLPKTKNTPLTRHDNEKQAVPSQHEAPQSASWIQNLFVPFGPARSLPKR